MPLAYLSHSISLSFYLSLILSLSHSISLSFYLSLILSLIRSLPHSIPLSSHHHLSPYLSLSLSLFPLIVGEAEGPVLRDPHSPARGARIPSIRTWQMTNLDVKIKSEQLSLEEKIETMKRELGEYGDTEGLRNKVENERKNLIREKGALKVRRMEPISLSLSHSCLVSCDVSVSTDVSLSTDLSLSTDICSYLSLSLSLILTLSLPIYLSLRTLSLPLSLSLSTYLSFYWSGEARGSEGEVFSLQHVLESVKSSLSENRAHSQMEAEEAKLKTYEGISLSLSIDLSLSFSRYVLLYYLFLTSSLSLALSFSVSHAISLSLSCFYI